MGNPRLENAPWFMMTVAILPRALKVIFDSCSQQDQFKQKHKPKICNDRGLSFTCSSSSSKSTNRAAKCILLLPSNLTTLTIWLFLGSASKPYCALPPSPWLCLFPKNSPPGTINWWRGKFQNSRNAVSANWSFLFTCCTKKKSWDSLASLLAGSWYILLWDFHQGHDYNPGSF